MDFLRILVMLCVVPPAMAQSASTSLERHIEAAQRAQAGQDCHTAAVEYAAVVHLVPQSGELRTNEAIALYCDGQLPIAITTFRKALALNPSLATPHLFLGLAAHRLGDETTAESELGSFLKVNPTDPTANLWLGYTYMGQHRQELAIEQFETVARADPANTDAEYSLGQAELEFARRKARELEKLSPNGSLILKLAAEQYRESGNTAAAAMADRESEQRRNEESSTSPEKLQRRETLYQEYHQAHGRALQAFQAVVAHAPESDRAHQILAESLVAMQHQEEAIVEYGHVLELNPSLPGIHESISNCLMHDGKFADALQELRAEERLQVDSARLLTEIGQVQLEMGDDTAATASLRKAVTMQGPPAEAFFLLGKALLRQSDAKSAISALQTYIARESNSPMAYYLLARAYRVDGNREAMNSALATYRGVAQKAKSRSLVQSVTDAPNAVAALRSSAAEDAEMTGAAQP